MEREEEILDFRKRISDEIIKESEENRMRNTDSVEAAWKEWSKERLQNRFPKLSSQAQACYISCTQTKLEMRTRDTYTNRINLVIAAAKKKPSHCKSLQQYFNYKRYNYGSILLSF